MQAGFVMVHVIARRAATKQSLKERLLRFARNDKGSGQSKNEVDIKANSKY